MSKLFTTILPSLLAGGLLFGSALTGAQPAPPAPAAPPAPPAPAARPPKPPKIDIDLGDIDRLVDQQIGQALDLIEGNTHIPAPVRVKVKLRLEKVRAKVKKRLAKIDPTDFEALGEELGELGEEIGEEMEEFGKEMDTWSKDFEKKMAKHVKSRYMVWSGPDPDDFDIDIDIDDDDDDLPAVSAFDDSDDLHDAMKDLGDLKLAPGQREQLRKLRAESDLKVANARRELDRASERLRELLESGNVSDQEIARSIDNVTRLEGDIRKARILAWVNARRVLDDTQRKKIESAAHRSK